MFVYFGGMSVPQDKLAAAIAYVQKTERTEDEYIQGYLKGVEGVLHSSWRPSSGSLDNAALR
jgi:hypothetical protein